MTGNFNVKYKNKDLMDKLEVIHGDIGELKIGQAVANGKVKTHEKWLYALTGIIMTMVGWLIYWKTIT